MTVFMIRIESGKRYGRHTGLPGETDGEIKIGFPADFAKVEKLKESARRRLQTESGILQQIKESISSSLIEPSQIQVISFMLKDVGKRTLNRCYGGINDVLMEFAKLLRQLLRSYTASQLPSRGVKRLPERKNDEASFNQIGETQQTLMFGAVEDDMFINLIAEDHDLRIACQLLKLDHVIFV